MNPLRGSANHPSLGAPSRLLRSALKKVSLGSLLMASLWASPAWSQNQAENQGGPEAEQAAEEEAPAAEAEPQAPPRYASRAERDRALLAARFPDEVQWLELPEEEALALFRPAQSATPKGALLLLYTAENPPHWPRHMDNLRRALPRHGWATLALTLPLAESAEIPQRPEETLPATPVEEPADDNEALDPEAGDEANQEAEAEQNAQAEPGDADAEAEQALPPRAERIANHLDAALTWLNQQGQGNLVVLVDAASAPTVMAHLEPPLRRAAQGNAPATGESPLPGPIRALILVSEGSGAELSAAELDQTFAVPELPVLDLLLGPAARLQERRRDHRDASRRQRLNHYQQLSLTMPDIRDPEDENHPWLRRVQSYMHRQAEGVEVRLNR